jgi:hypothetical protein
MFYTILVLLAPLAGLARTTNDIQREPKNRILNHPQRCPLDVAVDLITPTHAAAISVGVDVTTPHNSSNLAKKSYPSIPSITRTHLASICEKLQGRKYNSCQGDKVISALNDQHTSLIPFMADHLGVLRPFMINFLFHPRNLPIPTQPFTLVKAYNFACPSAFVAHDVAAASSLHVAHYTTTHWSLARPGVHFGRTYHTMTPQQWCFQALSLNITQPCVRYLFAADTFDTFS